MERQPGFPNHFNRQMIKTQEAEEFLVVSRIFLIFRLCWNRADVHGFSVIPDLSFGFARIWRLFRTQAKQSPIFIGWALLGAYRSRILTICFSAVSIKEWGWQIPVRKYSWRYRRRMKRYCFCLYIIASGKTVPVSTDGPVTMVIRRGRDKDRP